jgi:hypothetical protein
MADVLYVMFGRKRAARSRKPDPPDRRKQLRDLLRSGRFLGVKIHQCGCNASARYAGKFFSFGDAPPLPLGTCDAPECTCVYLGVTDRRNGLDRRESDGIDMMKKMRNPSDRRKGTDVWKGLDG